ncbi:family 43 glycosylhydrolase [Flavobacterium sp. Sd200]|uniref:family 43 glycosylhydrolase n=1 Tax=Flavobacterium sp. Sd200 TaxID=2692211 RepID=UPI0013680B51|nr:family 43 glycosylhydrolase [Flavobacterium sp. Sd200]MXN91495.1 family 43 glycosylhydrolase [Flavobacterium sp. Sd200]
MKSIQYIILFLFIPGFIIAQSEGVKTPAPKPLFDDPVYHGAADPTIVWNKKAKKWWMFYTNRRAGDSTATGVTWVHGTDIGIAESADGVKWSYKGIANINYKPTKEYTYWAPAIVENKGLYHMYLTYVPGIFADWKHPRNIIHLTSKNLLDWKFESVVKLVTDKVIDACVYKLPDGTFRMWYNNEPDGKAVYYADSKDLYSWTDKGKAITDMPGEGPVVFKWNDKYWMIVDNWKGLGVYSSENLLDWKRQEERLVELPGKGKDDQSIGGHADVIVSNNRAYLFYFTHPGRNKTAPGTTEFEKRRSVIQVTELYYKDGKLSCDRDEACFIDLIPLK